jgi:hypothetical protein
MKKNTSIDYDLFMQNAVRRAIRDLLASVAKDGMPGEHCFYIDFLTQYPGVELSQPLRDEYPEDMMIAIQHDFWDLIVTDDAFSVMLSFDEDEERIVVPLNAIIKFTDPSVDFGVEFTPDMERFEELRVQELLKELEQKPASGAATDGAAKIIDFDSFRKR